nr:ribonuclease H-like domain-containing protein [Tanacetum cinerariifolium]
MPYDDERVDPNLNSNQRSQSDSSHSYVPGGDMNIVDFSKDNSGNDAHNSDDIFAAQNEQTDAINSEMDALHRNDTWDIVDLPKDRKAIGSKWIFKIKYKSSGEIDRYKARLVAQGFGQKEGFDYEETFSHVVKMVTVRCLLNIVMSNSWTMFQLDVNNAFLYGDLAETVYMIPHEGYFPLGNKFMHSPLKSHLKIAFKILRYLKSCTSLGIHFIKNFGMGLKAFSNADWAKCVVTRRSVIEYCVFLNDSYVSWKNKNKILSLNPQLKQISLHRDSNSAIKIAVNPVFHERTKHLEIDLHLALQLHQEREFRLHRKLDGKF